MVDDTSQQPVQTNPQVPVVPISPSTNETPMDQNTNATSPGDIGQVQTELPSRPEVTPSASTDQQLDTTWPISPNLANDQTATPSAQPAEIKEEKPPATQEEKPPDTQAIQEPPKEEVKPQVATSEIGQIESSAIEEKQTWPNSPKLANSDSTASPSAQIEEPEAPISQETDSTKLVNQEEEETKPIQTELQAQTEEKPIEAKEPEKIPQPQITPTEVPIQEEAKPGDLANQLQNQTQIQEIQPEKQPENSTPQQSDINVKPPDNQASQVQSGLSDNASSDQLEKPEENLANFKPEPPEAPKTAKSEENISENSPQVSFGDINSGKIQPEKPAETPKPYSFGDLLKDQKVESKNNIPDDLFEIHEEPQPQESVAPEETKISSQSQSPTPQNPQPQTTLQQSSHSDQTKTSQPTNPYEPKVKEKIIEKPVEKIVEVIKEVPVVKEVIKEIKVTDEKDVRKRVSDHILSEQQNRRILANQARSNKKSKHLDKVMELARNTENISNEDIQRLLHVSQSTATNYLSELTRSGALKRQGIRGGAKYTL